MFQVIPAVLLFVVLILSGSPASAFTPDDGELASQMQREFGALTSWEAEMAFPDYPGSTVHLWYARGKWRQEWKAGDSARAIGMGSSVVAACTVDQFPLSPMFVWMPPNPVETWKSWGWITPPRPMGFVTKARAL